MASFLDSTGLARLWTDIKAYLAANYAPAVGGIIITSTNTDPSSRFGGTWTLINKKLPDREFTGSSYFTLGSNVTLQSLTLEMVDNILQITGYVTYSEALTDTAANLVTINYAAMGISEGLPGRTIGYSDAANGIAFLYLTSGGLIQSQDVIVRGSSTASMAANSLWFTFTVPITYANRINAYCDRFYWKRTA